MDLHSLTNSMRQKKSGIQTPTISGFGKQNLFEDGPLAAERLLIIPDFYTPARAYMPVINRLAKCFRVAIFELPGHFGAATLTNHREETIVLLFEQLLDFLGWQDFFVYAHGGGCLIAAILQRRLSVKKAVYCCPKTHLTLDIETVKRRHKGCKFVLYYDFTELKAEIQSSLDNPIVFQAIFNYFENQVLMTEIDEEVKNVEENNPLNYKNINETDALFVLCEKDTFNNASGAHAFFEGMGKECIVLQLPRYQFNEEDITAVCEQVESFFDVKDFISTELMRTESSPKEEMIELNPADSE